MDTDDVSEPESGDHVPGDDVPGDHVPDDHVPYGFENAGTSDDDHVAALTTASSWVGGPVQAVGIGETADGRPCVVVFADTPPVDLPDQVEDLPVRVEGSDAFHALRSDQDDDDLD